MRRVGSGIVLAGMLLAGAMAQQRQQPEIDLQAAIRKENVDGDLNGAIKQYAAIVAKYKSDRAVSAMALVHMADCYQKMGDAESRKIYEQVVKEYADQNEAATLARARLGSERPARASGVITRQIWTGPLVDTQGSVSRDGRYLSFANHQTCDLAVRDLVSGTDRRLTSNPPRSLEYAQESVFSPDARQVAYSWFNKDFRYELRVVEASGNTLASPHTLYSNEDINWIGAYDWSPDGKWIAVQIQRKDRTAQIGLVSPTSGSLRVLKSVEWRGSTKMFFSPDGRYLAFDLPSSEAFDQRDVFVLAVDGSREIPAVLEPANDTVMGWTPDGKHLLFGSDRAGSNSLWAVSFRDGNIQPGPRLIKTEIGNPAAIGVTPSGSLYFGMRTGGNDILVAPIDFSSDKTTAPQTPAVPQFVGDNRNPDCSPDGRFLAYNSFRRGAGGHFNVLVIRSLETGQSRELRPKLLRFSFLSWAPDARSFVVQGTDFKGRQGIYGLDAQNGNVEYVTEGGFPQWSADGKKIYFLRNVQREQIILERDVTSGEERELLRGEERWLRVSPDGRNVVGHSLNQTVLLTVPLAGGTPRELLRVKESERISNLDVAWTPDGRSDVFRKILPNNSRESELWLAPLSGGQPRRIELGVADVGMPAIHPNGKQIAVMIHNPSHEELWVMENFLTTLTASQ